MYFTVRNPHEGAAETLLFRRLSGSIMPFVASCVSPASSPGVRLQGEVPKDFAGLLCDETCIPSQAVKHRLGAAYLVVLEHLCHPFLLWGLPNLAVPRRLCLL